MKKLKIAALLVISLLMATSCSTGKCKSGSKGTCKGRRAMMELVGTLHRPMNGSPQIYLGEYGKIRRIDLKGKKLEGINAGTRIKITGLMRSEYFEGGTDADHLAMPAQWKFWIEVKDVEILNEEE